MVNHSEVVLTLILVPSSLGFVKRVGLNRLGYDSNFGENPVAGDTGLDVKIVKSFSKNSFERPGLTGST